MLQRPDLIFDIGVSDGVDTRFYRAIEARPVRTLMHVFALAPAGNRFELEASDRVSSKEALLYVAGTVRARSPIQSKRIDREDRLCLDAPADDNDAAAL